MQTVEGCVDPKMDVSIHEGRWIRMSRCMQGLRRCMMSLRLKMSRREERMCRYMMSIRIRMSQHEECMCRYMLGFEAGGVDP